MAKRNYIAKYNRVAFSLETAETAINTEQTLDSTLDALNLGSLPLPERRREDDVEEMTGYEERTKLYNLGRTVEWNIESDRMTPAVALLLCGYALGEVDSAAAGGGKKHTITPTSDMDPKTFTAMCYFGKQVYLNRYASLAVNTVSMTFEKDSFVKVSGQCLGTGKVSTDRTRETVEALDKATEILVSTAVLDDDYLNVNEVKAELSTGVWYDVTVTGCSGTAISITAPGDTSTLINYDCTYRTDEAWSTFPSTVVEDTARLRVSDLGVVVGGTWDGTNFKGGRTLSKELKTVSWDLNNNLEVSFTPGAATGDYANDIERGGRDQTVRISRKMYDAIFEQYVEDGDTLGIHLKCEGVEYEDGHKYTVEFIFPAVGLKEVRPGIDGRKLSEDIELLVLEDATYGSVRVIVKNEVASCAA